MIKKYLWTIKAFILQPIIPTVSMDYVLKNDGSYSANDYLKDNYVYYWIGDFKTGKQVKVKSLEVLRYVYIKELNCRLDLTDRLIEEISKVETHDLGENFVKKEIINIVKGEKDNG